MCIFLNFAPLYDTYSSQPNASFKNTNPILDGENQLGGSECGSESPGEILHTLGLRYTRTVSKRGKCKLGEKVLRTKGEYEPNLIFTSQGEYVLLLFMTYDILL